MSDKPMINLGCGTVILPSARPYHHGLVDEAIYAYPHWHNVDRNAAEGVDEVVDVFTYPWPWADNSFSGALLSHLVEHVPHEINSVPAAAGSWIGRDAELVARLDYLYGLQDGWFAFFSELWRVLEPGAIAHILYPHGHSDGALADPTHTRYVMPHTFGYLKPDERSTFHYAIGCNFDEPYPAVYRVTEPFLHLTPAEGDDEGTLRQKQQQLTTALMFQINVVYDVYTRLRAVKDANHD